MAALLSLGLNRDLRTQTTEKDFILTDQPSAVGWYADRKAIGIPKWWNNSWCWNAF